jgi:hypothetical protein
MLVKAFIAQPAVEAFDEGILHWVAAHDVVPVEPTDGPAQRGSSLRLSLTVTLGAPRSITKRSSSRTTRTPPI